MLQLLVFDLRRRFAPGERRLLARCLRSIDQVPPELRADVGLSDARHVDLARKRTDEILAERRAEEAHRFLATLNRIAQRRGFPRLRWKVEAVP